MRLMFAAVLMCLGLPAAAQDFAVRDSDRVLDADGMAADVVGRTHEFFDGGVSFFSVSGTYTYTYTDGARAYGSYALKDDGQDGVVCSNFDNGFSRCDKYVHDGTRLVLLTEDGNRFPVKEAR
ncbi:hypothetical protein SAMN05444003_1814 [Cognatiyoonia sediminum]|uniref:Secreted protein n=1 Tax=Cognatiyoonia sediminum TaxID=1508389 RepID=A0A1M5PS89_9RHOB|nr:hypothetical protein [Cognatiyoonia sediminum]SHH04602.1 hypothetical protein SAMN05444003_1814 [Cognatiyoonia sediminum]